MSNHQEPILIGGLIKLVPRGKRKIWTAEYWHNGKHRRYSFRTRNLKFATEEATKLAARLLEGTLPESMKNYPVEQAMNEFVAIARLEKKAKKTIVKCLGVFKRWLAYLKTVGVKHLQQITPAYFDAFRQILASEGVGLRTIHNYYTIVNGLMRWAKCNKRIRENQLEDMRVRKPRAPAKPVPTMAQINQILSMANERDLPIFAMAAFTGARIGDIRTRYVEDLDFQNNLIHFVARENAAPKGGREREVPLHKRLVALLKNLPRHKRQWLFTAEASKKYPAGDHHINDKHLNERLQVIARKLGMKTGREEGFTFHSLRRFFETHCVNQGIPQKVIDRWMGHSTGRVTSDMYYVLSPAESQKFMRKLQFHTR